MNASTLHFLDPNPGGHPAVLLLHGLGADATSWTLQIPTLIEAGFRPLAPDMPGFGQSPYAGRDWSIRRVAGRMAELLQDLKTGSADVVGLSMGGVIAQQLALDFPHLTRKLVLASTFSALQPENFSGWWYFIRRAMAVMTLGLEVQAHIVAQRVFPEPRNAPLQKMLVESIVRADPRAYRQAMRSLFFFDSRKHLRSIKAPTLVITGADDTTVTSAHQKLLVDGIPAARQVVIAGAGHAVSIDRPDEFNSLLLLFLQE